ncbi:type IV toxin-antitoxin system AbiEi family antitoxin [Rothia nasimurium]|uniref:type IV toxin-antitoxin system AbiEi family antitoxin n=1 Tax=Rothia nasimurium TaxID=85336 RepID=UPI001F237996|nr:type IV toxin-antitoxin system AbiEi family antitoxin [Rothia nasimurium]
MEHLNSLGALSELPFPLAPAPGAAPHSLNVVACDSTSYAPAHLTQDEADTTQEPYTLVRLYSQQTTGLPAQQWREFIKERELVHFHRGIYRQADDEPTPLMRAASLGLLTPAGYHHRIRYCRTTAAWVLGYLPELPEGRLHVDYDRDNRCNLPRSYRADFATHQAQLRPYDTMTIGPIRLTTPLKTALDIITHSVDEGDLAIVKAILLDSQNSVTPELLLQSAREQMSLKATALLRAQHLAHQLEAAEIAGV